MVGSLGVNSEFWDIDFNNRCGGSWSFVVLGVERTFISPEWQMDTWRFRGDRKDGLCRTLSLCHPNPLSGFFSLPRTLGGWTGWTIPWLTCHLGFWLVHMNGKDWLGSRVESTYFCDGSVYDHRLKWASAWPQPLSGNLRYNKSCCLISGQLSSP